MELVYDLEGNYLYSSQEILSEDLPITIVAVINQCYPEFNLEKLAYQLDLGEVLRYEVLLLGLSQRLEVILDEEGNLLCECDA
jgi:hypothetical protein